MILSQLSRAGRRMVERHLGEARVATGSSASKASIGFRIASTTISAWTPQSDDLR